MKMDYFVSVNNVLVSLDGIESIEDDLYNKNYFVIHMKSGRTVYGKGGELKKEIIKKWKKWFVNKDK